MSNPTAILLAGGSSRRMGQDKALLQVNGEALAARHVRQWRSLGIQNGIVVCNPANRNTLRRELAGKGLRLEFVLQAGEGMSGAVRTGIEAASGAGVLYLVCANDLILDSDYLKIEDCGRKGADVVIPSRILDRSFVGGRLELHAEARQVRAIVEKPPGGCPVGSAANIMVHRIAGQGLIRRLADYLDAGEEYETALNHVIGQGATAWVAWLDFWMAIKTPQDFDLARRLLGQ